MTELVEREVTRYSVNQFQSYLLVDFKAMLDTLVEAAEEDGYKDVKLMIESTMEPYENYPGDPEIVVIGSSPKTEYEIEEDNKWKKINALATDMGITHYEARTILDLKARGKL